MTEGRRRAGRSDVPHRLPLNRQSVVPVTVSPLAIVTSLVAVVQVLVMVQVLVLAAMVEATAPIRTLNLSPWRG